MLSFEELVVVAVTLVIVAACVVFHYEGLRILSRLFQVGPARARVRIAGLIVALIGLHVMEILAFAIGYQMLARFERFGQLLHFGFDSTLIQRPMALFDYMYFSATVYSTLGFGDIVPTGALRAMTGTEAVVGLVLITWSASFTFLKMQQHWGRG